ncbi:RagB/SusD family nutrient uptake outer membrane protein [Mariniflexile sp. AS56]|uniref:RagB/SusD family nutrient uptake outer membrane protein n=1 Tax=Mariniflexile sp. AS56 TaxID=3063957 RepID=UPI0026F33006|nr:RagB/SusD family nutrient uptake outer membrane protein [Mariniflexile sp. AS56]MDO7171648.1 RagB/SusD family nutrient uptake outer membrane protein [Mariniflexile sp. AS56]
MKRNIIKIYAIIPILFITLFSCDSYLQLEPQDSLIQQEFWQNKEQVSAALAGCYASMNQSGFTDKVLLWGELRGDMLVSLRAGNNQNNMLKNYMFPSNSFVDWSQFYKTINHCNLVLTFADQAQANDLSFSEQELKRVKAEALTIRSLVYSILVKNFREVPLILTATANTDTDFYPAKNTEDEIIAQITSDLEAAVNDLNLGFAQSPAHDKGKMTKGAALAILADVYLWDEQYDNCISATNRLVDLNKYRLVDGADWFNDIFFEGNSDEGIFELQFSDINSTLRNSFYIGNPTYAPYSQIFQLYNEFPDDIRGNFATFGMFQNTVFKYAGVDDTGVYRGQDQFYNTFIFYRYADVLLMQAEAYILSTANKDLNKAYNLISQVHERAIGAPLESTGTEGELLSALLLERQKELAFEGKRWYDILRFAKRNDFENQYLIFDLAAVKAGPDDYEQILSYFSEKESYYLPIYLNEVNLNSNLVQNPYYEN